LSREKELSLVTYPIRVEAFRLPIYLVLETAVQKVNGTIPRHRRCA
jgi:hypothetical protein